MTQPPDNPILAPRIGIIETSGRAGSVAVALGGELLAEVVLSPNARHAVELMPALEGLCNQQGWLASPNGPLDQLYLSIGPGSFTGLRIAVAIARSFAQATGCKLVAIPSLDVIAQNAPADFPIVMPVLDAKRGQIFTALYQRANNELHCIIPAAVVEPRHFLQQARLAHSNQKIALLGEGLDYHRPALSELDAVELPRDLWPARASALHRLAWPKAQSRRFAEPGTLLPIYIRLPEAEEVWQKKHPPAK